ncbi:hypothetical protein [Reyranella sp.]|uniref:hypothetical protein n=1 Tax=Reyranella sp. TaxID=1929291 RepID=UPI003C7DE83B
MNPVVYALTLFVVEPAPAPPVELRRYDSATECDIAVRTVRILQRGVRLQCVGVPSAEHPRATVAAAQRSHGSSHGAEPMTVLP